MKAYEFSAKVTSEGRIEIPDELHKSFSTDQVVKVIVLVKEQEDIEEHVAWSRLTSEQFLVGYSDEDAIYDRI